jgi:hypothetical protein
MPLTPARLLRPLVLLVLLGALALPGVAAAAPRTWVSGVGNDADACTRTLPCKTFAGAIGRTDAGGVIGVLDPGGFGGVTITKAITIDAGGVFAGVLVGATSAINVNAPGKDVVLRGLTIDPTAPCSAPGSFHGIRFMAGRTLRVENTVIRGFSGAGVSAEAAAGGSVTVTGSELRDNCTAGLIARTTAGAVDATLSGSFLSHDRTGVLSGAHATVRIAHNTIVNQSVGLATENGGALVSAGDNRVGGNTVDGAPTATVTPWPKTTTTTPPPVTPAPAPVCKVPRLSRLTLAGARKRLAAAHCRVGTVRYQLAKKRSKIRRNRVSSQQPQAGWTAPAGAKVVVTINGRKPKRKKAKSAVAGGATRTWVSGGVGNDANPCSRTAPCLTFAGALGKTSDGGTIDVLDSGDFGPLVIDAPVTIDGAGHAGGVQVGAGATAIVIAPGAGKDVTLRGLDLVGPGCSAAGAGDGIKVLSGGAVHLRDVTARGFAGSGVAVAPTADLTVTVRGGAMTDNCGAGISATRPGGAVGVTVDGAILSRTGTGVLAGEGSTLRLTDNAITGNAAALAIAGNGLLQSWGGNQLSGNAADGPEPAALKTI